MNILYTNFHPRGGGGHDTYIKTLINIEDNTENFNYSVACPVSSHLYQSLNNETGINLLPLDFPGKPKDIIEIIKNTIKLARFIRENSIDIIHTNGSADNRIVLYARLFSRKKFKIVHTKHNSLSCRGWLSRRRLFSTNDAIIIVSQSIYDVLGRGSKNNAKFHLIRNGIDTNKWVPPKNNPEYEKIILMSIAGTDIYKGWHHLINAINMLPDTIKHRFLVKIAGHPPDTATVEKLTGTTQLPEWASFCGFLTEPQDALKEADIGFVLSTDIETISFACREMMSAGLPVIVSDYGGLAENITAEVDGWVTPAGDTVALSHLLLNIITLSPAELLNMKKNARKKSEMEFGKEMMINKTHLIYKKVMTN